MTLTSYFTTWLKDKAVYLRLNKIEQDLHLPQGCLSKAIRETQPLPIKHMNRLLPLAIEYGFKIYNKELDYNEDAAAYTIGILHKDGRLEIRGFENLKELCDYFNLEFNQNGTFRIKKRPNQKISRKTDSGTGKTRRLETG